MVSTSARNAGGPWFDSRSRHDRLLYANSVCLYNFLYRGILYFFNTSSRCSKASFVYIISCIVAFSISSILLPDAVERL